MNARAADAPVEERPWPMEDASRPQRRGGSMAAVGVAIPEELPPHSTEGEQGVLGCVLLEPEVLHKLVFRSLTAGSESFYDLRHQEVYRAFCRLHSDGIPIDLISLQQHLKDHGKLESSGGLGYLASLPDSVPSAANCQYYVNVVKDKWRRRQGIKHGVDLVRMARDESWEMDEVLTRAEASLVEIRCGTKEPRVYTAKQAVHKLINYMDELCGDRRPIVSTGFPSLSAATRGGMHYKDLWVIAGRPGMGKTTLAVNMATRISYGLLTKWRNSHQSGAKYEGRMVDFYSFEQPTEVIIEKAVSARAKFGACAEMEKSDKFDSENPRHAEIRRSMEFVADLPIRIHEQRMDIDMFCADVRHRDDTEVIFIDYLQLFLPSRRGQPKIETVSEVTERLMELAKERNIPIVLLCQMNREYERDKRRPPRMSDLRDSGTIEQDAHTVIMLWEGEETVDSQFSSEPFSTVSLRMAKNRGGPPFVDIPLNFHKECSRFEDPNDRRP